ncbi:MAG: caspase family protein [Geminicoccaceae bacterium]
MKPVATGFHGMRPCRILFLALIFLLAGGEVDARERRVALVIGNSNYQHASELPNPDNDAHAIGSALRHVGFDEVTVRTDLNRAAFQHELQTFTREARDADVALVFYAGHGIEMSGQNFLIPVDAELASDVDIDFEAVPLDLVMRSVDPARKLRIVLLDACRNNPFANRMVRSTGSSRSVGRGLARIEPPGDMLVAYAAKDGQVAEDGYGSNSPFTTALLEYIDKPGLEIQFLFRKVRDAVLQSTGYRQEPHVYGSLGGDPFYFIPPDDADGPSDASGARVELELAFWKSIESSRSTAPFEEYLRQFPNGVFAGLARIRIDAMRVADEGRTDGQQVVSLSDTTADGLPPPRPVTIQPAPVPSFAATAQTGGGVTPTKTSAHAFAQVASLATGKLARVETATGPVESTWDGLPGTATSFQGTGELRPLANGQGQLAAHAVDDAGRPVANATSAGTAAVPALGAEVKVAALLPKEVLPVDRPPAPGMAKQALPGMLILPTARPATPPLVARNWLQEVPCTVVDVTMHGARLEVNGYSREPDAVVEAVRRLPERKLPPADDVSIEPLRQGFCAPVDTVRKVLAGREDVVMSTVDVRPARRDWFAGDQLELELRGSRHGHVNLALFSEDGTVQPLAVDDVRDVTRRIADGKWRLPASVGQHLLMAVVTDQPLELTSKGEQPTSTYLSSLEDALQNQELSVSIGFAVLRSRERPAPVASTPAPEKASRPAGKQAAVEKTTSPREDPQCADILIKAQLGEYLTHDDRTFLQAHCH